MWSWLRGLPLSSHCHLGLEFKLHRDCLAGARETAEAQARDSAVAESGAPVAREEEEDDDADAAADGTQSNDAEGKKQIRDLRRFVASRCWGHYHVRRTLLVFGSFRPERTSSTARAH